MADHAFGYLSDVSHPQRSVESRESLVVGCLPDLRSALASTAVACRDHDESRIEIDRQVLRVSKMTCSRGQRCAPCAVLRSGAQVRNRLLALLSVLPSSNGVGGSWLDRFVFMLRRFHLGRRRWSSTIEGRRLVVVLTLTIGFR